MARLTGKQTDLFGSTDQVMDLPLFGGSNVVAAVDPFEIPQVPAVAGDQLDLTSPSYVTEDGKTVRPGDRVYNYYDCEWGTINPQQSPYKRDGWFDFTSDAGARRLLNGQRISTYKPGWAR